MCVQELRESLWDISDKRKEEDEQERAALMGWLEDHIAILINNHSILIQVTFLFLCKHLAEIIINSCYRLFPLFCVFCTCCLLFRPLCVYGVKAATSSM